MKNFSKATAAVMVSALCAQASIAAAQDSAKAEDNRGWYVGGELSYANGRSEVGNLYTLDEDGLGFGVYGGYNFTEWFGLEGASFHSNDMADDREGLYSAEFVTLSFMPKFTLAVSDAFGLYAKAGPTFVLYTEEYDDYYGRYWDDEADWSEVILGAGVGAQFKLPNGVRLRLSYDYVSGKLDETWDTWDAPARRVDVTLKRVGFGVHYQF